MQSFESFITVKSFSREKKSKTNNKQNEFHYMIIERNSLEIITTFALQIDEQNISNHFIVARLVDSNANVQNGHDTMQWHCKSNQNYSVRWQFC